MALETIDLLWDPDDVSNGDLKGLLKRIDAWQYDRRLGADAKAARGHEEAAREPIAAWMSMK